MPDDLPRLIDAGRAVKAALAGHDAARHPTDDRLSGIYGTILCDELGAAAPAQRDGVRRRRGRPLALRLGHVGAPRAARRSAEGETLRHDSIVGTTFHGRIVGETDEGVLTEIEGTAFRTGEHRFTLDPRDPLGTGFVLR